ncbi:MAG TPA: gephyrin-like molybdotransferase Glp [Pirellulales bacterium]|jgi:molybdopterin molybdotransferase|nr:gephyrin-like molybdotransferase Glp [Pirellulales bacterium]
MISVDEALRLVLAHARANAPRRLPTSEALGLVLAEQIASDVDSPPHDKSLVDGYALASDDFARGHVELAVVEQIVAGDIPQRRLAPGETSRIMTGAPLPAGADAVVMLEHTLPAADAAIGQPADRVRIVEPTVRPGQNVMPRAASFARGQVLLAAGHELRPIELGLLAEIGRGEVSVIPPPVVAVLATGNELVAPSCQPGPGQIRNSNSALLLAAVHRAGAVGVDLGISRDEPDALARALGEALSADVVLVSGGVSAGVLDLVPGVLGRLGVEQVFHRVRVRPGKPLWFGVLPADAEGNGAAKLVFGLPGNPVSGLVTLELFVRPALARLAGHREVTRPTTKACLAVDHAHRGDRPTYHPARLETVDGQRLVRPVAWRGSSDLAALVEANALAALPAGDYLLSQGETIEVLPF